MIECKEYQQLIDDHDPDATDEELENLGIVISYKSIIGVDSTVNLRDGCGHKVVGTSYVNERPLTGTDE